MKNINFKKIIILTFLTLIIVFGIIYYINNNVKDSNLLKNIFNHKNIKQNTWNKVWVKKDINHIIEKNINNYIKEMTKPVSPESINAIKIKF